MTAVILRRFSLTAVILIAAGCAKSESPELDVDMGVADANELTDRGHSDADDAVDMRSTDMETADLSNDLSTSDDLGNPDSPVVRTVADACSVTAVSGGEPWDGWANLQFPDVLTVNVGEVSEPIFGQTYADGQTNQPGMADGWEGQLVVGPYGTNPETQPDCFRALDAEYNVDVGNNDEWWVRLQASKPGIWNMYYRFRPPGGLWRYGDLNGSDDGATVDQAGTLIVEDPAGPDEIRVVTLNLRCRIDNWALRQDLVIRGLVAADPHVIAFQEDCSVPGQASQSTELAARLAEELDRGFAVLRTITHQAMHTEGTFDEGIALLSAFPIESNTLLDLPFANFPRRAIVADLSLGGGESIRVISTHLEFGGMNDDVRNEEAVAIVAEVSGATVVLGDMNTDIDDPAYATFDAALDDVWPIVGAGDGFTIPASSPVRRNDFIWFDGLTAQSADVIREVENNVYLSDHLGVTASFVR